MLNNFSNLGDCNESNWLSTSSKIFEVSCNHATYIEMNDNVCII